MIEYKFHPPEHLRLSIEHVISRSRGGADCWDNLVAACRRCNSWRSAYTLKDGHEISAIAWFYKRQAGEDVRPLRQRRQKGPAIVPKGQVLAGFSAAGQPIIQPARKKSSPYSGTSRSRFKALSRRLRAQEVFCGHDVQFGSNRLPKVSTPAVPIEGATLGSLWPR